MMTQPTVYGPMDPRNPTSEEMLREAKELGLTFTVYNDLVEEDMEDEVGLEMEDGQPGDADPMMDEEEGDEVFKDDELQDLYSQPARRRQHRIKSAKVSIKSIKLDGMGLPIDTQASITAFPLSMMKKVCSDYSKIHPPEPVTLADDKTQVFATYKGTVKMNTNGVVWEERNCRFIDGFGEPLWSQGQFVKVNKGIVVIYDGEFVYFQYGGEDRVKVGRLVGDTYFFYPPCTPRIFINGGRNTADRPPRADLSIKALDGSAATSHSAVKRGKLDTLGTTESRTAGVRQRESPRFELDSMAPSETANPEGPETNVRESAHTR
ncbi:hypothetical protein HDV05_001682, partial [Chytridiales sp. JEL 0842]